MDHSYPYIASLTREPFLFYEMRSTAKLMAEGNSDDAIVKEIVEQELNKKLTTLQAQDTEIKAYEEKIHHLADQMISIDLDDGVKKNYAIFQDVLAKIK